MASLKIKFRPSSVAGNEGSIYYQIVHERKVRQILSDYHVYPFEWDSKRSVVVTKNDSPRRDEILYVREKIRNDVERISRIIAKFDLRGINYSTDDIISEFDSYIAKYSVFSYMESLIVKLKQNGRMRTSETYYATLQSFRKFRCNSDIMLDCITSDMMEGYEAWMRNRGLSSNTVSFYNRVMRAVYNRAVNDEVIENRKPFRRVYTGVDKTVKRALPPCDLYKIQSLDLSSSPHLDYARDMFMMSFFFRGMSFVDMAFLRKSDLSNGYISYRRRKTGQLMMIEWTPEMQAILSKYPLNPSHFLLPIIKNTIIDQRCAYRNAGYIINHNLKSIGKMIGLRIPLTLYVARHSWASVARNIGVPLSVISAGMGHDSEATTQIYLASIDTSIVDHANSQILKSIFNQ